MLHLEIFLSFVPMTDYTGFAGCVGNGTPVTGKVSPFLQRFVCCVKTLQHDTSYLSNPDLQHFTVRNEVIWSLDMTIHILYSVHKMFCCLQQEKIGV